jgi:hypothetical protein
MEKKKPLILITLGSVNVIHALLHLLQFIQSVLLGLSSVEETPLHDILTNPIVSAFWALIGIFTLYIGIKDFNHHKDCH